MGRLLVVRGQPLQDNELSLGYRMRVCLASKVMKKDKPLLTIGENAI